MKNLKKIASAIVAAGVLTSANSFAEESCVFDQFSPGGSFLVCQEPTTEAVCSGISGEYSAAPCDTTSIVGSCVTSQSSLHYYTGDAASLETGCGFQGGTWTVAGEEPERPPTEEIEIRDAMPIAYAALHKGFFVDVVDTESWYQFSPKFSAMSKNTGVILFSGGSVDSVAYAPMARTLALSGYDVFLLKGAGVTQIRNPDLALEPINENPDIATWAVGGHSLGGVISSLFLASNFGAVDGIFFWASEPAMPITYFGAKAASIYATYDLLETVEEVETSKALFPADAVFTEIVGGNHAQFGWYGAQDGDGEATISRAKQQLKILKATRSFLRSL